MMENKYKDKNKKKDKKYEHNEEKIKHNEHKSEHNEEKFKHNEEINKCECNRDSECSCKKDSNKECKCDEKSINEDKVLIAELNEKIKVLEEAYLREKAEVANYKRRKDEEVNKMLKYKNEDILKDFLPIMDNFERAIKMDDNDLSDEVSKFLEGFKLIYSNTLNLLNRFDIKEIEASGLEFDPTYHHAVLTEHDENKPAGVVLEVLQKGYMYKDKVIRPAMVKVNE